MYRKRGVADLWWLLEPSTSGSFVVLPIVTGPRARFSSGRTCSNSGRLIFTTTGADASGLSTGNKKTVLVIISSNLPENSQKWLPVLVLSFGDVSALQCCAGNSYGSETRNNQLGSACNDKQMFNWGVAPLINYRPNIKLYILNSQTFLLLIRIFNVKHLPNQFLNATAMLQFHFSAGLRHGDALHCRQ